MGNIKLKRLEKKNIYIFIDELRYRQATAVDANIKSFLSNGERKWLLV